ncbi:exonuclease [Paenibacillus pasadenensis]|uniref:exonuclease n=1 Tax=Paenibacillus pasadenensis TaxID=217090 RepID=UPI00204267FD|nr:exonuclease [Paenibacillus pasadenensis]MCM3749019.1 exonuclease [Paenibacillus pasadenensis]
MNMYLILLSLFMYLIAYFTGVKRTPWLLSAFAPGKVRNRDKLFRTVSLYNLIACVIVFFVGIINLPEMSYLLVFIGCGYVILLLYCNRSM